MNTNEGKPVSFSAIDGQSYLIAPNALNPNDTISGRKVFEIADELAATVAMRHSGKICVTRATDALQFPMRAHRGEILMLKAAVNRVWNTSLEVGVKIYIENPLKSERRYLDSWYFVFVALNEEGKRTYVRPVIPETDDERRRYDEADIRRVKRLGEAKRKKAGA